MTLLPFINQSNSTGHGVDYINVGGLLRTVKMLCGAIRRLRNIYIRNRILFYDHTNEFRSGWKLFRSRGASETDDVCRLARLAFDSFGDEPCPRAEGGAALVEHFRAHVNTGHH